MSKRITLLIVGAAFVCAGMLRAEQGDADLYVKEFEADSNGTARIMHIVSYAFNKGHLAGRDTVLSLDMLEPEPCWLPLQQRRRQNRVLHRRFVILSGGLVIDGKTRRLVAPADYCLAEVRDNNLVFSPRRMASPEIRLSYDIITGQTRKFVYAHRPFRPGLRSPDNHQSVEYRNGRLYLWNFEGEARVLTECSPTVLSMLSSSTPQAALYWLNNREILFADYKLYEQDSAHRNAEGFRFIGADWEQARCAVLLKRYDLANGEVYDIGRIDSLTPAVMNASFTPERNGRVLFHCQDGIFLVDAKRNTVSRGYNRQLNCYRCWVEWKPRDSLGCRIVFHNRVIGATLCRSEAVAASHHYVAAELCKPGANLAYPDGLRIYSSFTQQWMEIDIDWLDTIIGWVPEQ